MPAPDWEIGPRLKAERTDAKMSLARLSSVTGISKTYLMKLETESDANPSLEVLRRIAEAFELTVADLVGAPPLQGVPDELDVPASLKAFADEARLTPREVETLASIRWRKIDQPRTVDRWRYIYDSLKASKVFDA